MRKKQIAVLSFVRPTTDEEKADQRKRTDGALSRVLDIYEFDATRTSVSQAVDHVMKKFGSLGEVEFIPPLARQAVAGWGEDAKIPEGFEKKGV